MEVKRGEAGVSKGLFFARRSVPAESGFTLLELIITLAIITVLALGTIPVARNLIKREREKELRRTLREIRTAIDAYYYVCDRQPGISFLDRKVEDACYPPKLETLVEGVHLNSQPQPGGPSKPDNLVRFLRRIPNDPITGKPEWGMRSVQDDPDSTSWGGQNVYNVYSKAPGVALDGKTRYYEW
ncbi:MAG: type II secretion system protein [Blastocatellia bacterium]